MSPPRFRLPQKTKDDVNSKSPPRNDPFTSVPRFSTRQGIIATPAAFTPYLDLNHSSTENIQDIASTQDVSQLEPSGMDEKNSDEEMLFDTYDDNEMNSDPPLSKRQKLSDDVKLPFSPKQPSVSVNRFISTGLKATRGDEQSESPYRPKFIVPAQAAGPLEATLPAIFSPQRTMQRLLPSGLASSLRTEIMELTSFKGDQTSGCIPSGTKLNVVKVYPMSGYTAAQCRDLDGSTTDLLLFGNGQNVVPASVLVLKGINWSINIQSKSWVVVLDWTIED